MLENIQIADLISQFHSDVKCQGKVEKQLILQVLCHPTANEKKLYKTFLKLQTFFSLMIIT